MNLRRMIYLFSTVWLLIMLLIVNVAIYFLFAHMMTDDKLDRMSHQTQNIVNVLNQSTVGPGQLLPAYLPEDGMIRITGQNGRQLFAVTKNQTLYQAEVTKRHSQFSGIITINDKRYGMVTYPMIQNNGEVATLAMIASMEDLQDSLNILKIVLIFAFFIIIIPSFLGGRALGTFILRPILSLIDTMEENQQSGRFQKITLKKEHNDELSKLAHTFNRMMAILKQHYDRQRDFVSNASHELRTPLTVIESYANLLKRWGRKDPEILDESIEAIHSEAVRMRTMTNQMLALAQNEDGWQLNLSDVDLIQLSQQTAKTFSDVYERNVHVHHDVTELKIQADEEKLKEVLFILLDNALKYSSADIDMDTGYYDGRPSFAVTDHGIGIPQQQQQEVFERFFRVDKAHSRENGGTGLGLTIARDIIHAHNGTITLDSQENVGTVIRVIF